MGIEAISSPNSLINCCVSPLRMHSSRSVRVAVRIRDSCRDRVSPAEGRTSLSVDVAAGEVVVPAAVAGAAGKGFKFDRVWAAATPQAEVFESEVAPLVRGFLDEGRSAAVICYGVTGAGKTFTIHGRQAKSAACSRAPSGPWPRTRSRGCGCPAWSCTAVTSATCSARPAALPSP
jgi:hypothetical protein